MISPVADFSSGSAPKTRFYYNPIVFDNGHFAFSLSADFMNLYFQFYSFLRVFLIHDKMQICSICILDLWLIAYFLYLYFWFERVFVTYGGIDGCNAASVKPVGGSGGRESTAFILLSFHHRLHHHRHQCCNHPHYWHYQARSSLFSSHHRYHSWKVANWTKTSKSYFSHIHYKPPTYPHRATTAIHNCVIPALPDRSV